MRFIISCAATLVLAIALLAACNSNDSAPKKQSVATADSSAPQKGQPDGVRRITVTELKNEVDKGTVLIVDTRPPEAYAQSHIKGSINFMEADVATRADELPRDKLIVAYCSCGTERSSVSLALKLKAKGFTEVAALLGGTTAWENAGLPMDKK